MILDVRWRTALPGHPLAAAFFPLVDANGFSRTLRERGGF
jgi:hypothetical protein